MTKGEDFGRESSRESTLSSGEGCLAFKDTWTRYPRLGNRLQGEPCFSATYNQLPPHLGGSRMRGKSPSLVLGCMTPYHPHSYWTHSENSSGTPGMGWVHDLIMKSLCFFFFPPSLVFKSRKKNWGCFTLCLCHCFCTRSQFGCLPSYLSLSAATQRHMSPASPHGGKYSRAHLRNHNELFSHTGVLPFLGICFV